jgi:hypothetical protein
MYSTGCFIVFLLVLLIICIKGSITVRDLFISLLVIVSSWAALILLVVLVFVVLIGEFWNTTIWKAKKKPKLSKTLNDLLN